MPIHWEMYWKVIFHLTSGYTLLMEITAILKNIFCLLTSLAFFIVFTVIPYKFLNGKIINLEV